MKGERGNPHETRKNLLNYLKENPKATIHMISSALRVNKSTLRYHLRYLEKKGEISSCIDKGKRKYFNKKNISGRCGSISRNQERVLNIIKSSPGISRNGIKSRISITSKEMTYVIKTLRKKNLIIDCGDKYKAFGGSEMEERMLVVLAKKLLEGKIDEDTFHALKHEIQKNKK